MSNKKFIPKFSMSSGVMPFHGVPASLDGAFVKTKEDGLVTLSAPNGDSKDFNSFELAEACLRVAHNIESEPSGLVESAMFDSVLLEALRGGKLKVPLQGFSDGEKMRIIGKVKRAVSIYFISAPATPVVKIGMSLDIRKRFMSISTMSPVPLVFETSFVHLEVN